MNNCQNKSDYQIPTVKPYIVKRDQKRAWMKAGKTNDRFAYVADNDSGHAKIICFHA